MAKAEKLYERAVTGVRLELTPDEAKAIATLIHRTGGSPFHSARKYTDQVGAALREAGVTTANHFPVQSDNRATYFQNGLVPGDYPEEY